MELNYSEVKNKIVSFLRKETDRIGIKKAVIGLSGGIDSATSAFLAAEALGKENLLCVLMPYKTSSPESVTDALKVVHKLGVRHKKIEITEIVDTIVSIQGEVSDIRKGNIMARTRMILLFDESNKENAIVIGTGNKTEIYLGYTTIYGDSACSINPIGDLYKTQIFSFAEYLGVPESILKKKPSADLWQGQTDEGEMGILYAEVDKYLYNKFDLKKSSDELFSAGFNKDFIDKVELMIKKNEFKRFLPPIAIISN